MLVSRTCATEAYTSINRTNAAQASIAGIWTDGAGWLAPREEDALPATAVCVADPVPAPVAVPFVAGEEAAVPGVPLTVVLGTNGTPFIAACTSMPSPTLIQSSCMRTRCQPAAPLPKERLNKWMWILSRTTYQNEVRVAPVKAYADVGLRGDGRGRVGHVGGRTVGDENSGDVRVEEVIDKYHAALGRCSRGPVDGALRERRIGEAGR